MITKPLDRINEAYKGDLGDAFSEKTRVRINWIVNHVKGNLILDIGCSQGIVPIILGREGKIVDALDIAEESIQYAKSVLNNEHKSLHQNITFRVSNFMTETDLKSEYETILLTEVLEHISDPERFLKKIYNFLSEDGEFIVTVPFGINDYFDHKRTYYLLDLYDQLSGFFDVEKIEFLGKWLGIVCKKKLEPSDVKQKSFNRTDLEKLEKGFFEIEKELLVKIKDLQKTVKDKNLFIQNLQASQQQLKLAIGEKDAAYNKLRMELNEIEAVYSKLKMELSETVAQNILNIESLKSEKENLVDLLDVIKEKNTVYENNNEFIRNTEKKTNFIENKLEEIYGKLNEEINLKKIELKNRDTMLISLQEEINNMKKDLIESLTSEKNAIQLAMGKEKEVSMYKNAYQVSKNKENENSKVILDIKKRYVDLENKSKKEVTTNKKRYSDLEDKYKNEIATRKKRYADLDDKYKKELAISKKRYADLEDRYKKELATSKKRYAYLENKYEALKDSKLGLITLKYWNLRKKIGQKARGN